MAFRSLSWLPKPVILFEGNCPYATLGGCVPHIDAQLCGLSSGYGEKVFCCHRQSAVLPARRLADCVAVILLDVLVDCWAARCMKVGVRDTVRKGHLSRAIANKSAVAAKIAAAEAQTLSQQSGDKAADVAGSASSKKVADKGVLTPSHVNFESCHKDDPA